jgi:hypothetical protein
VAGVIREAVSEKIPRFVSFGVYASLMLTEISSVTLLKLSPKVFAVGESVKRQIL